MPARIIPFVSDQHYHVFNRGLHKQPIFLGERDYHRAQQLLEYYSFADSKMRFSKFLLMSVENREEFLTHLREKGKKLVEIISYVFMPNHFHFLLKQKEDHGITRFMSNFQNSYTRYFNTRHKKTGYILGGQFKAVRVEDDEQLLHLSRYIHLNPYSSYVVKNIQKLSDYLWSSLSEYLEKKEQGKHDFFR